jgi:hypothetical protein
MKWLAQVPRRILERSLFNPASWLACAAILFAAWGACHLLGWRADTAVISGTADPAHGSMHWVMLRGTTYALTYFAAITLGTILILSSGMFVVLAHLTGRRKKIVTHADHSTAAPPQPAVTSNPREH